MKTAKETSSNKRDARLSETLFRLVRYMFQGDRERETWAGSNGLGLVSWVEQSGTT